MFFQDLPSATWAKLTLAVCEHLFVTWTPTLSHQSAALRTAAVGAALANVIAASLFRTLCLIEHLRNVNVVRAFLLRSTWRKQIEGHSCGVVVLHGYLTGLVCHLSLLAPWLLALLCTRVELDVTRAMLPASLLHERAVPQPREDRETS